MDSRNGGIDPDVERKLLKILDKPYKRAKICIFRLLSKSKQYNLSHMFLFTSALDHIAKALVECAEDKKMQLKSLDLAEENLREASIESMEAHVAELLLSIKRCLKKPRMYYYLTGFSLPDKSKIDSHMNRIERRIQRGRQLKEKKDDWELCLKVFDEALEEAALLKNQLPDTGEARFRFSMILLTLMGAAASIMITAMLQLI